MEKPAANRPSSPLWNIALERYKVELEDNNIDEYQAILEHGTLEDLVEQIKTIQQPNAQEKAAVSRLDSILKFVNDFSAVVAVCLGAEARLAALVWGSIRIILTLASSTGDTLHDIVDVLEELCLTLPRFKYYERTLPLDEAFETALVDVYTEVICFYARTIQFYRINPHGILRRNAWAKFYGDFGKTIQRIKRLSLVVESEADAARMRLEKNGYAEVLELMKTLKENRISPKAKPCYYVPVGVTARFWGREDILREIQGALDPTDDVHGQKSIALSGMGGVGKTQVALHYASISRQRYQTILWVSADSNIQLLQSFREVAQRLDLIQTDDETKDATSAMMKVKNWLTEADHRWLLIFDNADDPDVLSHAWPYDAQGSILITTRNPNLALDHAAGGLQIYPFDELDGAGFLLKLTSVDPNSQPNQDLAKDIAHTLGSLPLALSQVGGFINQRKIPLHDFLPLYRRTAERIDSKKTITTNYEHTISTVWEMSLSKLSGHARLLQQILAFLDPDKISEDLLKKGSLILLEKFPDLEFLNDELDLLDAEEILLQAALISKDSNSGCLSIHRLIQATVIRRLSSEEKSTFFHIVIRLLCWGFPNTFTEDMGHQHQSWERSEKCLPHIEHIIQKKGDYRITLPDPQLYAEVLLRCCWYLYEREFYDTARIFMKEALHNFQDHSSLAYASAVELLGLIDMDTNFQEKALQSFTQTIGIRKSLLGPEDPFIAASLTTLGIVHTELGNLDEAYDYHQKAIEIRLKTKSDRIGNSYSNMSSLLLRMGKPDEAEEMLKRCPSLKDFTDETFLMTGNPRFSGDMVLLARIRERQGRLEEATSLASKALGFRQRLLGNRLKTCDSLFQVASLLTTRGNIASAIDLLNECVAISESLPEGEGQSARAMFKLSTIYAQEGKIKQGEEFGAKAQALKKKILCGDNLDEDESEEIYNRLNLWMLW